jgi:hypothetical protein
MPSDRFERVRQLFGEALDRPEADRMAYLQSACEGDAEVFRQVKALLEARAEAGDFLDTQQLQRRMGRYLIRGELGRGAMGIVYEATDPLIGRTVAIKVIHLDPNADSGGPAFLRERLYREARSAGMLFHPGIAVILDVGEEGDIAFIAMERVDGPSLYEVLQGAAKIAQAKSLSILREAAAALDYAHSKGVVHRDIKPANIMLDKGVTVKVTEFGVAKIVSAQQHTLTGLQMGTPSYMSPEQVETKALDGRSDQFSLAVVAYELLTGARPFQADTVPALLHSIAYGSRPSAKAINPELPDAVDSVLRRAMARVPDERYANCCDFVNALATALDSPPTLVSTPKPTKRWPYVIASAAGLVLIAALLAYRFWPAHQPPPPVSRPAPPAQVVLTPPPAPVQDKPAPAPVIPPATPGPADTAARAHQLYLNSEIKSRSGQAAEGIALLRQAAELGEPNAMVDLGVYLQDEVSTEESNQEAAQWFRKAAEAGKPGGMLQLGACYDAGTGVPHDDQLAVFWYRKAADHGSASALFNLGKMYELGRGVPKDLGQARSFYQRAASLDNGEAKRSLARLAGH